MRALSLPVQVEQFILVVRYILHLFYALSYTYG